MPFPNALLRKFVEQATEKSFDKGFFWGVSTGVFVTHFIKEDSYKKLETKYFRLRRDFLEERFSRLKPGEVFTERLHANAEVPPDGEVS